MVSSSSLQFFCPRTCTLCRELEIRWADVVFFQLLLLLQQPGLPVNCIEDQAIEGPLREFDLQLQGKGLENFENFNSFILLLHDVLEVANVNSTALLCRDISLVTLG